MTGPDRVSIRQRAEAATPGPWKVWGMSVMADPVGDSNVETALHVAYTTDERYDKPRTFNASHIAGMDPATTIALLDALDAAEAERDDYARKIVEVKSIRDRMVKAERQVAAVKALVSDPNLRDKEVCAQSAMLLDPPRHHDEPAAAVNNPDDEHPAAEDET